MANPYTTGLDLNSSTTIASNPFLIDLNLTFEEQRRIQDILTYWQFYHGNQWKNRRPDGEPQVTANYVKAFIDKGVAFLAGKGFVINVEPEAEEVTKPFLDRVWDDNNRLLTFLEMSQMGSVSGDCFVEVGVETYDPDEEPHEYELYPKGRIRITVLPSSGVFVRFDAHNRDRIIEVNIVYKILLDEDGQVQEYWYRKRVTRKVIEEYISDKLISRKENPLKLINIVHIKNIPVAGEPFGQSDVKHIIPLQKELNEKATDISDIINYHAAPVTIVKGARANNIERGARKIWSIPKDGDVFNLELKSDLSAAMNYLQLIKTAMFEIGKIPENALGAKKSISNTSGVALHIENQPLMELTRQKWATYGKGIQEINMLILKFAEMLDFDEFDTEKFKALDAKIRYKTSVDFQDPLPKDELIQMQLIAQKLALHLETRLDALKELGEHNAKEKLEEIKAEIKDWNQLMEEAGFGAMDTQNKANSALQTNVGGIVNRDEKADPNNKKPD